MLCPRQIIKQQDWCWDPFHTLLSHHHKCVHESESVSHSVVSESLWLHGLQPIRILCPWNSLGKNTGEDYCCLVTQSSPATCNPMDCSTPGLPVPHHLLEFAQVHVYCIGDVVQPSHPLMPPSPSALNLSQHQDFSNEWSVHIRWPKYWCFSFSISPSSKYAVLISLKIHWFDLLAVQGTFRSLLEETPEI